MLPVTGCPTDVRLVVWDSSGRLQLARDGELPCVLIEGGAAVESPAVLVDAIRHTWGFDAALVRTAAVDVAEVEYLGPYPGPPDGFRWHAADAAPAGTVRRPPWQYPGWHGEILKRVDPMLSHAGLRRTGPPAQTRHTSITGMLRIPTDRHPVWLKAVLPIFAHEPRVIRWLSRLDLGTVPTVIAEGPAWWLSAPFPPEGPVQGSPPADHLAKSLAELQIASTPHVDELKALGCPDRPLGGIVRDVAYLIDRPDLVTPSESALLRSSLPRLAVILAEVDALGFPATLVHGDLNPENMRYTRKGWFLFDWTDACVAHPFVDLVFLVHADAEARRASGLAAYGARWARVMPRHRVERALRAAPVIGAAHQVVSYQWILDAVDRSAADVSGGEQLLGLLRHWIRRLVKSLHC